MLLPDHPPELPESLREGSLSGDVGVLTAVAIYIVSIDVVTAWDPCMIKKKWKLGRTVDENGKRSVQGEVRNE